jgi:hypothetical protein
VDNGLNNSNQLVTQGGMYGNGTYGAGVYGEAAQIAVIYQDMTASQATAYEQGFAHGQHNRSQLEQL